MLVKAMQFTRVKCLLKIQELPDHSVCHPLPLCKQSPIVCTDTLTEGPLKHSGH